MMRNHRRTFKQGIMGSILCFQKIPLALQKTGKSRSGLLLSSRSGKTEAWAKVEPSNRPHPLWAMGPSSIEFG